MRYLALALALLCTGTALARSPDSITLGGVRAVVWRPRDPGPHPLLIFSHGFHGNARQSTFLTTALADHGWLVVAPEHADSTTAGQLASTGLRPEIPFLRSEDWTDRTHRGRHDDIAAIVNALKDDPTWQVDWSRFALAGHSLGGYTALACAGAWPSWTIPGITAVLALSPYAHPFAHHNRIPAIRPPVMYISGTRDLAILPTLRRPGGVWDQASPGANLVVLQGAGHFAFADLPSPHHARITAYALDFLDRKPIQRRPHTADFRMK